MANTSEDGAQATTGKDEEIKTKIHRIDRSKNGRSSKESRVRESRSSHHSRHHRYASKSGKSRARSGSSSPKPRSSGAGNGRIKNRPPRRFHSTDENEIGKIQEPEARSDADNNKGATKKKAQRRHSTGADGTSRDEKHGNIREEKDKAIKDKARRQVGASSEDNDKAIKDKVRKNRKSSMPGAHSASNATSTRESRKSRYGGSGRARTRNRDGSLDVSPSSKDPAAKKIRNDPLTSRAHSRADEKIRRYNKSRSRSRDRNTLDEENVAVPAPESIDASARSTHTDVSSMSVKPWELSSGFAVEAQAVDELPIENTPPTPTPAPTTQSSTPPVEIAQQEKKRKKLRNRSEDKNFYKYCFCFFGVIVVVAGAVGIAVAFLLMRADSGDTTIIQSSGDTSMPSQQPTNSPSQNPSTSPPSTLPTRLPTFAPVSPEPSSQPSEFFLLYDPPSEEDCIAIANGETLPGQDILMRFAVPLDVELQNSEDDMNDNMPALMYSIQEFLIPSLAGCFEEIEVGRRLSRVKRFVVLNADPRGEYQPESGCGEDSQPFCHRVWLELDIFVKGPVEAVTIINLLGAEGVTSEERGTPVDRLQLKRPFVNVHKGGAINLDPTESPSVPPTIAPSESPSVGPSLFPSVFVPTNAPTMKPSVQPVTIPTTLPPSPAPTRIPSRRPTEVPVLITKSPTVSPTPLPSHSPSAFPTIPPSSSPSAIPSRLPSNPPTQKPSPGPTTATSSPTIALSNIPSSSPSPPSLAPTPGATCYKCDAGDNLFNACSGASIFDYVQDKVACDACIGGANVCTGLARVTDITSGSCTGKSACQGADFGFQVYGNSCIGEESCMNLVITAALCRQGACRGFRACKNANGKGIRTSCFGDYACYGRQMSIGWHGCEGDGTCAWPDAWTQHAAFASSSQKISTSNYGCMGKNACISVYGSASLRSCQGEMACAGRINFQVGQDSCVANYACTGLVGGNIFTVSSSYEDASIPEMDLVVGVGSCLCSGCCVCMTEVGDGLCNTIGECCDANGLPIDTTIRLA